DADRDRPARGRARGDGRLFGGRARGARSSRRAPALGRLRGGRPRPGRSGTSPGLPLSSSRLRKRGSKRAKPRGNPARRAPLFLFTGGSGKDGRFLGSSTVSPKRSSRRVVTTASGRDARS